MNCLDHLHYCKAECCKQFSFSIEHGAEANLKKTQFARFHINNLTPDLIHYYKLHNAHVDGEFVVVEMRNYKIKDLKIIFNHRCRALMHTNKCLLHERKEQPIVCHTPNAKGEVGEFMCVTENCLYKELYERRKQE